MIGYRLPNNKSKDILIAGLVGQILSNGKAGLLDLNLVKKQKLLWASVSVMPLIDYGMFVISAAPTSGQTLDEVKTLLRKLIAKLTAFKAILNRKKERIFRFSPFS